MKRILTFSGFLVVLLLILSGCTSPTQTIGTPASGSQTASSTARSGNFRRPDFGQPDRQADVRGIVKSITGNEVTVLKIDLPAGGRRASSTPANGDNTTTQTAPVISFGGNGQRAGGGDGGGFRPGGGPGGPGGGFNGGGTTDRAARTAALKALSTGEDKIIIPVGIKMMKSSFNADTKKNETAEATLTDVTADKSLMIWLNAAVTDKKVAEFVLIN